MPNTPPTKSPTLKSPRVAETGQSSTPVNISAPATIFISIPPGNGYRHSGEISYSTHKPLIQLIHQRQHWRNNVVHPNTGSSLATLIPVVLQLQLIRPTIYVLIYTGCLQTNIIRTRVAALLGHDGGQTYDTDVFLTAGVGGCSYGIGNPSIY